MKVTFWENSKRFSYIDTAPSPDDVVYDVPQKFVERYVNCMNEFFKIQNEIEMFIRTQDSELDREDAVEAYKMLRFK